MMPNKNTVSAVSYVSEIKEAVRLFGRASARFEGGEQSELSHAVNLCPSLCLRAKSAAKNIAAYKVLPAGADGKAEAFFLAEAFFESG